MKSKTSPVRTPDEALKKLEALNARLEKGKSVKVGLPKGSNDYPDGTSVILVGATHEFGSPKRNIPERSYLRSALHENRKNIMSTITKLSKKMIEGEMDMNRALHILGLSLQKSVVDKITDLDDPPLKYREGNPLIDTGHLRQSIVYRVDD